MGNVMLTPAQAEAIANIIRDDPEMMEQLAATMRGISEAYERLSPEAKRALARIRTCPACDFVTSSRFRWAWHCFWRPIT